ncbi:MAG: hypothetical protein K8Q97_03360 [Candidatus Andersenbacteria bacterium]|nr:hypothetical protein [Candidatus Andersenbacteria bacterium]
MQNNDVPEILVRLEKMDPKDFDVRDYRELMQRFHDWNLSGSPYADRAKTILRKASGCFTADQLRIK